MTTSQNNECMAVAVSRSIVLLLIKTPPNAETGSPARASLYATDKVSRTAKPQALLCFKIPKAGLPS